MTPEQVQIAEGECLRVLTAFYRHLDASCYDQVLELWHREGVWVRGRPLRKEEMLASLQGRSSSAVVHHIVTSALFDFEGERARFSCYITSLRGDTGRPAEGTIPLTSMRIYLGCGEMRCSGERWLISSYDPGHPRLEIVDPTVPPALTTLKKDIAVGSG